MACNFASAIARIWKTGANLGIRNEKHVMRWIFQVFALTAGLYWCQLWATTCSRSILRICCQNQAHVHHVCFLKSLLGVRKATESHCLLRETGQMPCYFYWLRCIVQFWNSLLTTNSSLLSQISQADLLLADQKGAGSGKY